MTNTDQLKVGDRVMVLPIYDCHTITPFTTGTIAIIGKYHLVANVITDNGKDIYPTMDELQPLPTKFDGWEEE